MVKEHLAGDGLEGFKARDGELPLRQLGLESHRIKVGVHGEEGVHDLCEQLVLEVHGKAPHEDLSEELQDLAQVL